MEAETKRVMLSITPEMADGIDKLKKEQFYDKPYSDLLRYLISRGLEAAENDV